MTTQSKDQKIDDAINKQLEEKHIDARKMFSQAELAKASGLSTATVNRYLKNKKITGTKAKSQGRTILYSEDVLAKLLGYKETHVDTRKNNVPQRTVVGALGSQLKQSQMQIVSLQEQLKAKDEQIAKQQSINDSLIKQNEELQELLKATQSILKHNDDVISKHSDLINEQNKLLRDGKNEPKKGFWYKLFH